MEFYEGLVGTAAVFLIFGIIAGISTRWSTPRSKEVMTSLERTKLNKNAETLGSMAFFLFFLSLVFLLIGVWVGVFTS